MNVALPVTHLDPAVCDDEKRECAPALAKTDRTALLLKAFSPRRMRLPQHYPRCRPRSAVSRTASRVRRLLSRRNVVRTAFLLAFGYLSWLFLRPWETIWLLSPAHYRPTIRQSITTSFPASLHDDLLKSLESTSWSLNSSIPNTLFQTDRHHPSKSDQETWIRQGFERVFFDDAQAAAWVDAHFGDSEVARVYHELPLPILKADLLRYLVLLVNGGVYSDVDTRALLPVAMWNDGAIPWPTPSSPISEPRIIVGIEGGAYAWRDKGGLMDLTGFKRGPRHRFFQFVQWTIASKSLHPILVDTIRRVIDTSVLAHAYNITHLRRIEELESAGRWPAARKLRKQAAPWEHDTRGDRLTVQEWTGPAAFTDAVLSYLLAVAGLRQEDLYAIDRPVQIADVVILPMDGFNPIIRQLPRPWTRVVHLFRGSWKKDWHGEQEWSGI